MITLNQGINRMLVPKVDMPTPMPAVVMLQLVNTATNRQAWCELTALLGLSDWYEYEIEVVGAGADPLQGQIAMNAKDEGQWKATIYGGAVYSESPSTLTELRKERVQYV
jgi:hypothetical protein